jgi:hypothetical protein
MKFIKDVDCFDLKHVAEPMRHATFQQTFAVALKVTIAVFAETFLSIQHLTRLIPESRS